MCVCGVGPVCLHGGSAQPVLVLRLTEDQDGPQWYIGVRPRCQGISGVSLYMHRSTIAEIIISM